VSSIRQDFGNSRPFTNNANCTRDDFYRTRLTGSFTPLITGLYEFSVDGDDAVDFSINNSVVASWYGAHGASNSGGSGTVGTASLIAGQTYTVRVRHQELSGGSSFNVFWKTPATGTSTMTDRNIRVETCPSGNATLREDNCVVYSNGQYKPTGILHDYGATDKMLFGLLTGSYAKNLSGGVLRSQLQSFAKEFNAATGQFCSSGSGYCTNSDAVANGIVSTIDKLRVVDFNYGNHEYACGFITNRPINPGECNMWGNPIGEMMYETMRYFAGATTPTPDFDYASNARDTQAPLSLPKVNTWTPPYKSDANPAGAEACAVPVMTVISDINPSYDFNLPGSNWTNTVTGTGDPASMSSLNVSTEADAIWAKEGGGSRSVFIGESGGVADNAPTAKTVSNLSTVRGLAPEEPSKQGTYYSAAIAHFGANNKIGGDKELLTYSVALASPLPTIAFPVGGQSVTIVPFAKSVGGSGISATSNFQPTNQIVDYYVETIANTSPSCTSATPAAASDCDATVNGGRPYAKFRINFEDVEQGADHDMDAIAVYEIKVNAQQLLDINIVSEYAAGGIDQHMGYVISGTTRDGIYLEVKDQGGADVRYRLDTPVGRRPGECATTTCEFLGLSSSRTFTPSGGASANLLNDPLWYAAKYGTNAANPDVDNDGVPDNYFLVTNALTLKDQLDKAFNNITQMNASISSPSVDIPRANATSDDKTAFIYRSTFDINGWTGNLIKEQRVTTQGTGNPSSTVTQAWNAESVLPASRNILMAESTSVGNLAAFSWANLANKTFDNMDLRDALNRDPVASNNVDGFGQARVSYLRGDACVGAGCDTFRVRDSKLGDIIGSSPVLVSGAQYLAYRAGAVDGGVASYSTLQAAAASRPPMIYVGANDGMLHAFNATTGVEQFAFVPTPVIPNLNKLTASDYGTAAGGHQFYVDGSPVVADVYFGGSWRTVLVGSLGAGGRGLFALDVTNPASPQLLWEFTSDDDADLGYTLPAPTIARLHTGQWSVLVPNGYNGANSGTGKAVLFALDIATGSTIRKFEVQSGTDGVINSGSNGLSNIRTADMNGDGIVDYVYGGDMQGNVWRFDMINAAAAQPFAKNIISASSMGVSFGGNPLFVAREGGANSTRQPITAAPSLVRHPTSAGYLVVVGTGSYLNSTDRASTAKQSVYGIWDRQTAGEVTTATYSPQRSDLLQQTLTAETLTLADITRPVRILSENTIRWFRTGSTSQTDSDVDRWGWFIDLAPTGSALDGERVIGDMRVYGDGLIFSTVTPNSDPCASGLNGFNYGINARTGGRTAYNVFDFTGDGRMDLADQLDANTIISGFSTPAGGFDIGAGEQYFTDGSSISIASGLLSSGRQTWRRIPKNVD
jgi:type IV pilus assembly protein PilY1